MPLRETTQKLTILITATRQSARRIASPIDTYINNQRVTVDTFGNIDPEVFFDDLHLHNKIGTKRLVANINSGIGLRREGNREQANGGSTTRQGYKIEDGIRGSTIESSLLYKH